MEPCFVSDYMGPYSWRDFLLKSIEILYIITHCFSGNIRWQKAKQKVEKNINSDKESKEKETSVQWMQK